MLFVFVFVIAVQLVLFQPIVIEQRVVLFLALIEQLVFVLESVRSAEQFLQLVLVAVQLIVAWQFVEFLQFVLVAGRSRFLQLQLQLFIAPALIFVIVIERGQPAAMIFTLRQLEARCEERPAGYRETVLAHATVNGANLALDRDGERAIRTWLEAQAARPLPADSLAGLENFFARVAVINLAKRTDRKERLTTHLHEIGWPFKEPQWIVATPGSEMTPPPDWPSTRNIWAGNQTHRQIIEDAFNDGLENVLIFEDDAVFLPGFDKRMAFFLRHVPDDWGMLMIGGSRTRGYQQRQIIGDLHHVRGLNGIECYAIHRRFMPAAIELLKTTRRHSDEALHRVMWEAPTYTMRPALAMQWQGYSDNFERQFKSRGRLALPTDRAGAVILSTGEKRRLLMANAAASFRRNMPRMNVRLFTDRALRGYDSTPLPRSLTGDSSRDAKTRLLDLCPFEWGIVLDDDTVTLRPFPDVDRVLDGAEIAMAADHCYPLMRDALDLHLRHKWGSQAESDYTREQFPDCDAHPHFNSGVIFFHRGDATRELSRLWHEEWKRFRGIDQLALYRAIRRSGIAVKPLPPELHYRAGMRSAVADPAIVHIIGSKWKLREWLRERGLPVIEPRVANRKSPRPEVASRSPSTVAGGPQRIMLKGGIRYEEIDGAWVEIVNGRRTGRTCGGCASPADDPAQWGPPLWREIHAADRWDRAWPARILCPECQAHTFEYLAAHPPPIGAAFKQWAVDFHNAVNRRLGRPEWGR